ncbi:hypothetical protein PGB90_004968 [Kerria lacca]
MCRRSHLAQCGNCPHCGKTYSNQSALKYHVRLMHCDLTNQFSCYLCPMSFAHRDDYKAHMWEIHKLSMYPQTLSEYSNQSNINVNPDLTSQSSLSLFSSNSNYVLSTISNENNSFPLVKDGVMNQFGVSDTPLT